MDHVRERLAAIETSLSIYSRQIEKNNDLSHRRIVEVIEEMRQIERRVSVLERKIAVITAIAAMIGSLVGAAAQSLMRTWL